MKQEQKVIGVGASAKGTVLHIVVKDGEGNRALCEKRMSGLIVDKTYAIKNADCKKCQASTIHKNAMAELDATAKKETPKPKPKPKPKSKLRPEPEFEMTPSAKKKFKIIHVKSGRRFFEGLEQTFALNLTILLNQMKTKWDGKGEPKGNFLSECKKCIDEIFKMLKPEGKQPVPKAKKAKAKAVPKTATVVVKKIKRRKKTQEAPEKKDRLINRRANSPATFIIKSLEVGCLSDVVINNLQQKFGLGSKKAKAKFKGIVRKLVKCGDTVQILKNKDLSDHYKILDTTK